MNEGTVTTVRKLNTSMFELDSKLNDAKIPHDFWCDDSDFHDYHISYPARVGCIYGATSARWIYGDDNNGIELYEPEPNILIDDEDVDYNIIVSDLSADEVFDYMKKHFDSASDDGKMRLKDYIGFIQNTFNLISESDDDEIKEQLNFQKEQLNFQWDRTTITLYGINLSSVRVEATTFSLLSLVKGDKILILDAACAENCHILNMHTNLNIGHLEVQIGLAPLHL